MNITQDICDVYFAVDVNDQCNNAAYYCKGASARSNAGHCRCVGISARLLTFGN